ncbi:MAG TPA: DNA primase [Candidatus Saccharimonadales bacterium]|jgi:DNA primase|nr:DNA primase [Candidatus Saccharimonadales bacterium]
MANPGDFAYTVKQQADIVRVIGDYVKLKKSGAQNFSGLCPFHQEKTPSFSVHATRQYFHCFGCGVSGDVFTFVQKIENITFPEAVRAIAQKMGIPLPKVEYSSPAEAREAGQRGALIEMHERACAFFQEQLRRPEAAHARDYLATRGVKEEIIREFRLGFAPDSGFLLRDRLKADFNEELQRASGLFSFKSETDAATIYSKFRNRIMFPIANDAGKVIAFTGRTLSTDDKAGPKYLNSPETPIYSKSKVLYNLDRAKEAIRKLDYAIIVEGQMDCIAVYSAGFRNVIASSGTAFSELQVRLLARFSKNIVVNFDPDTAGAAATDRSLAMLVEEEFVIKVMRLEAGFDPDLFIKRNGAEAYGKALQGSTKYFEYLMNRAMNMFPVKSPEGKVKAVNFLLPHIQRVPSRIIREGLAGDIAQKLGIDSTVLRAELKTAATQRSTKRLSPSAAGSLTTGETQLVRLLFCTSEEVSQLGYDPREVILNSLSETAFHVGLGTETLLQAILDQRERIDDVLAMALEESDRQLLMRIISTELPLHSEAELKDLLFMQNRRLKQEIEVELPRQIQEAIAKGDSSRLNDLMDRKMRLIQRMRPPTDISRSRD